MNSHSNDQSHHYPYSSSRVIGQLFRKHTILKLRKGSSLIEFALSILICFALYPIWYYSRESVPADPSPPMIYNEPYSSLFEFLTIGGNVRIVAAPNTPKVKNTIGNYFDNILSNGNFSFRVQYANTIEEMYDIIQKSEDHGIGILWLNSDEADSMVSPNIQIYYQSFGPSADTDLFSLVKNAISSKYISESSPNETQLEKLNLMIGANISSQIFPSPPKTEEMDISVAIAFFAIFPIILASMPDLQIALEEKDNKIAYLQFLMGCRERDYWFVVFANQFICSIIPYIVLSIMLGGFFALKGSSISLLIVASVLLCISQISFQMWLMSLFKKGSSGRAMTGILIVMVIMFGYLHYMVTIDEKNESETLKGILSLIPFSSYQMLLMTMYRNSRVYGTVSTWERFFDDGIYPIWKAIAYLSFDSILYLGLFIIFNMSMERLYGRSLLKWRDIFDCISLKRVCSADNNDQRIIPENEEFLSVNELSRVFNDGPKDVVAVNDVSFSINRGEIIAMIGPNGAGKSSLLNMLSGSLCQTNGSIKFYGSIDDFSAMKGNIGVCFQENVVFKSMSIEEHFHLFGAIKGIPSDILLSQIDFFSNCLQLKEMIQNRAGDLSGGQKRKLCIALSLLGNPEFVIMDEPTAGVDIQARQLIWKTISALKNTTCIISSHALEEAEVVCSKFMILSSGKIPFFGTSTQFRNTYKCGYILRIDCPENKASDIFDYIKTIINNAELQEDSSKVILIPICDEITSLLENLHNKKEDLCISSLSFSVEQLEDILIRLIQEQEVNLNK